MKLLHEYINGNYTVKIYEDGTKIRETIDPEATVFDSAFPENIDVCITKKCDVNCPYCYESCSPIGNHSKLFGVDGEPLFAFMNDLTPGTEFAINGNDLDHPELEKLLRFLKEKGVIANMTVNQIQFMQNLKKIEYFITFKLIYGLGVSVMSPNKSFIAKLKEFYNITPNIVLHTIVGVFPVTELINSFGGNNFKLLILGYKDKGRGKAYKNQVSFGIVLLPNKILDFKSNLKQILKTFDIVSFDNLALEQLDIKNTFFKDNKDAWDSFYQGNDGSHTFYVDLVNKKFAKNSITDTQHDIDNMSLTEMFNKIKNT